MTFQLSYTKAFHSLISKYKQQAEEVEKKYTFYKSQKLFSVLMLSILF